MHKRGSHGDRVVALDHLAYRVWVQYILSADDFGVMRASPSVLLADNPRLETEPVKKIEAAMAAVTQVRLVDVFTHQNASYWWQTDWQDFQQIKHPRQTILPAPPLDRLAAATPKTQALFRKHRQYAEQDDESTDAGLSEEFGKVSEAVGSLARAPRRETHTQTPPLPRTPEGGAGETSRHGDPLIDGRAARLHGQHAWCSLPRDGFCVPRWLHAEFVGKRGGEPFEGEVRAWYPTVLARYAGQPVGDRPVDFWRNAFAAWLGTVTAAPAAGARGTQAVGAFERAYASMEGRDERRTTSEEGSPRVVGRGSTSRDR